MKGSWLVRSFPKPRPRSQAVLRKVSTFSWSSSTLSTFSSTFAKSLQSPAFFVSILFASQTSRRNENDIKYAGSQHRKPVLEVRSLVHLQPIAVSVFWNAPFWLYNVSQHVQMLANFLKKMFSLVRAIKINASLYNLPDEPSKGFCRGNSAWNSGTIWPVESVTSCPCWWT